ncbi:nonstructural protein [robinz microvirus RP_78]|nr:nonstructural protein [robinz microvirus RP_78]
MILQIFSVRDVQAEAFMQPFFAPAIGAALRSLTDAVNDEKHEFSKHSSDYTLYHLGSFDDNTGMVIPEDTPKRIISCLELVMKTTN